MSRVAELTSILEEKVAGINRFAQNGIKIDGSNVEVKSEDAAAVKKLFAECQEIKSYIEMAQFGVDTSKWLGEAGSSSAVHAGAMAKMFGTAGMKSLGEMFISSQEFKDFQPSGRSTMAKPYLLDAHDVSGSAMQRKDVYGAADGHAITMGIGTRVQFDPMVPRAQRRNRVRDLFPAASTSANLIDYFKVLGFAENNGKGNAQTVADYANGAFGLKPQSKLRFLPDQAPVRTVAHWEAAHRNVIQDVPQLRSTIDNELLYGLALVEDDQLLNGDGTGENIKGLLQHPGIQIYTAAANELGSDSLRRATTLGVLANLPPTGFVLHPVDWEEIELQKGWNGTTGDGQYMLFSNISIGAAAQVWRQPVVETPAMPQGTFLNGAFGTGAQVYDREQASVRIAEQHADFFLRNAVVILVEERLALAVKRPEAFVRGTFG